MKRLQNRIAEGGKTLPTAAAFGALVWLAVGLVQRQLWPQLACFVASVYLLVELSNQNALLRVRSRMVSSAFILLSCQSCFLFPQLTGAAVQLSFVTSFILLFQTYQDQQSVGRVFYSFAAVGVASLFFVHALWYVPALWVLMGTQLQSLSVRTWLASLIGLATPYWLALVWLMVPWGGDFAQWTFNLQPMAEHFSELAHLHYLLPPYLLERGILLLFVLVLAAVGIMHFWSRSFEDKIRIRLLFGFFTTLTVLTAFFILAQPQHYDVLMRLLVLFASPLIAHVFTFTSSRLSSIFFFSAIAISVALTLLCLFLNSELGIHHL